MSRDNGDAISKNQEAVLSGRKGWKVRVEYFSALPAASGGRLPAWRFNERNSLWDFPGGPVVKTSSSNAGGVGSTPDQGAKILHASWPKSQTNKQTKQLKKNRSNIVTNSIKTFKMVHIQKKTF